MGAGIPMSDMINEGYKRGVQSLEAADCAIRKGRNGPVANNVVGGQLTMVPSEYQSTFSVLVSIVR